MRRMFVSRSAFEKPEALGEVLAHLVAVEQLDLAAPGPELVDHDVRDRALARPPRGP